MQPYLDSLQNFYDRAHGQVRSYTKTEDHTTSAILLTGGAVLGSGLTYLTYKLLSGKYDSFNLSSGSIERKKLKEQFDKYDKQYDLKTVAETGISDRDMTAKFVDDFYSFVTDVYEVCWGSSFHFSPGLPGKDWSASEAAHEGRVASILGLKPGSLALDAGCGVGGPMRTICAVSGAEIIGITINQHQVDRAKIHNKRLGMEKYTKVYRDDFNKTQFKDNTFDGIYAIEATCHADKLETVFAEFYRILKPGSRFLSYEWVSTPKYDRNNELHRELIGGILYGNGLPIMRSWKEAEEAGKNVGFELLMSQDLAHQNPCCTPWYKRLSAYGIMFEVQGTIVKVLQAVGISPKGKSKIHDMLITAGNSLIKSGELDIFTPMHMLVFEKPKTN